MFIVDVTPDESSRVKSEAHRAKLSARVQPNATKLKGHHLHGDYDQKTNCESKSRSSNQGNKMQHFSVAKSIT